jgi:hypothetical protein
MASGLLLKSRAQVIQRHARLRLPQLRREAKCVGLESQPVPLNKQQTLPVKGFNGRFESGHLKSIPSQARGQPSAAQGSPTTCLNFDFAF